jgi:hypothetical protein
VTQERIFASSLNVSYGDSQACVENTSQEGTDETETSPHELGSKIQGYQMKESDDHTLNLASIFVQNSSVPYSAVPISPTRPNVLLMTSHKSTNTRLISLSARRGLAGSATAAADCNRNQVRPKKRNGHSNGDVLEGAVQKISGPKNRPKDAVGYELCWNCLLMQNYSRLPLLQR